MTEWHKASFKGIEYRKHKSRKHGVKFDRYFRARFMVNGQQKVIGLGWSSEGWSEEEAALKLKKYRENMRRGAGPTSPKEEEAQKREQIELEKAEAEAATEAKRLEAERLARENITVSSFWKEHYYPGAKIDKASESVRAEERNFRIWIEPVVGNLPIKELKTTHIERIKHNLLNAPPPQSRKKESKPEYTQPQNEQQAKGRSPRTIEYVLAIIRQIINKAKHLEYYHDENPVSKVKKPCAFGRPA